ncbi:MAG: hypothetical protein C4291_00750 [Candidatus Dadabacteria bacterium]
MRMILREWTIRLGLIVFGFFIVVVSMVALEFYLSRFTPHILTLYKPDEYIGWKGIPNFKGEFKKGRVSSYVRMNSHGFRDKERSYEKGKDTFRIVVLGDSFTEGMQVPLEQTFPYILEERLNSGGSSERFEVINLGVSGFGTAQEYLALKYYGLRYHPDLVILEFFIGNDVVNNSLILETEKERPFFVLSGGKLEELPFKIRTSNLAKGEGETKEDVAEQFRIKYLILRYSTRFFPNISYSLEDRIKQTPWLANLLWKMGIVNSKPQLPDKSQRDEIPLYKYIYAESYSREWEDAWEITKGLILKLANELEAQKIGFLVVVIPNEYEFRSDIWDKILGAYPQMRSMRLDLRKPEGILSRFFESNGIEYLLLRSEFERYTKETGKDLHFHFAYENHWNADGHALAADLIYKKLKDKGIVSHKGRHV